MGPRPLLKTILLISLSRTYGANPESGTSYTVTSPSDHQCLTACEKNGVLLDGEPVGEVELVCPPNHSVTPISALYGRLDSSTCPTVTSTHPAYSTNCQANGALDKVAALCEGKESCIVQAHNHVFGDPCVGIEKYLTVCYKCTGLFSEYNINVADKCCFIVRSPRDATYILTDPFAEACSGGCAYKPYGSYGNSVCLKNIRLPTCCSYSTGALCQLYGNRQNEKNIAEKGTCSDKCQEIANYSTEPSNNWFKNETIREYSPRSSSFRTAVSGPDSELLLVDRAVNLTFAAQNRRAEPVEPYIWNLTFAAQNRRAEPVEQSAKVYPLALKSERFKRSGGECSWIFAWIFTCYNADCYCQFMTSVDWYAINENEHYFKHECCSVFQPRCPGLPSCPST